MAEINLNIQILSEIDELSAEIQNNPDNYMALYERGRLYWKLGQRGAAISDYESSAQLNGSSPAVEALRIIREIMDFYNTDLYNP